MGNPLSILLVDDDPHVLKSVARVLRRQGWQVTAVDRAAEALNRLAREDFYVVISDLRMPDMDGIEFLSVVAEQYPGTLPVMLSGNDDDLHRRIAEERCGVRHYLGKPWNVEELTRVTDNLLHEAEYMRMSL